MKFWFQVNKKYIVISLFVLQLCVIIFLVIGKVGRKEVEKDMVLDDWLISEHSSELLHSSSNAESENASWVVDIKGQVISPGVYEVDAGMRINDVIQLAGGITQEADTSQLNFAQALEDQMMIYVPEKGELNESIPIVQSPQKSEAEHLINLNTADLTKLQELNGIGEKKAQAIIQYRTDNGSFQSIESLMEVSGIGQKTFDAIKDTITVSN